MNEAGLGLATIAVEMGHSVALGADGDTGSSQKISAAASAEGAGSNLVIGAANQAWTVDSVIDGGAAANLPKSNLEIYIADGAAVLANVGAIAGGHGVNSMLFSSATGDRITRTGYDTSGNYKPLIDNFVETPHLNSDSGVGIDIVGNNPCYCRGTLILTELGEQAVEDLAIGDRVATRSGLRPIKWVGRRGYDPRFIRGQKSVLPVVLLAGALAHGVPSRDLWVSPEHALYLNGALVPARLLVNGMTIVQVKAVDQLEYFHIELDSHDVILAEGAPAETYIECDNRLMFHNAAEHAELYPDALTNTGQFCALRLEDGATALTAIHTRLLARAAALGHLVTDDPGLHLVADGITILPLAVEDGVYRFTLDHPAEAVYLASRSVVPAETDAGSTDRRRLGVCLRRITLSDADLTLDLLPHIPQLRDGFHEAEGEHRWTAGMARLPAKALNLFTGPVDIEIAIWPTQLRYAELADRLSA